MDKRNLTTSSDTKTDIVLVEPASAVLARDAEIAEQYRRYTKAEATQKGYRQSWRRFCLWARGRGSQVLPASVETIVGHLGWLATRGYSRSTIDQFLASAAHFHSERGLEFPRSSWHLRETLRGIRRSLGIKQKKRTPLKIEDLVAICERLSSTDASFRLRALLCVGWFGLLRSDNLVAIKRSHVEFALEGVVVHLPRSKTDQEQEGRDVALHAQDNKSVCPSHLLTEYFRMSRPQPDELIFDMSERTVSRLVKRLAADPAHEHVTMRQIEKCDSCAAKAKGFGSHSLRRGAATSIAESGATEEQLMEQGGWKNARTARGYVDKANLFKNNPTKGIAK